ncbi:nematocyst expressed protein 3-like isoform X1 [Equus asinus]|uniref:nematocyst expressed protein 3-like isoform X1 n=1 Tax=Equus asinus TaxID=9793 RepID=UPI0038F7A67F
MPVRRPAAPAARTRRALAPLEIIFTVLFFPPSPVTFSPNRKMKCKSSFAAGGPRSPLSGSGSRSEMRCPRQCEPRGTEWGPQPSAPGPAAPPAETAESGCAPRAGALRTRRVAGLTAGSSASPRLEPAALGASSALLSPLWEFCAPAAPGPLSPTPQRAGPPAGGRHPARAPPGPGRAPGAALPPGRAGGSAWKRSQTSSPRCSDWNLESAGNCSNTRAAPLQSALALLKRSSSHQSLASPSPRKPRAAYARKDAHQTFPSKCSIII